MRDLNLLHIYNARLLVVQQKCIIAGVICFRFYSLILMYANSNVVCFDGAGSELCIRKLFSRKASISRFDCAYTRELCQTQSFV